MDSNKSSVLGWVAIVIALIALVGAFYAGSGSSAPVAGGTRFPDGLSADSVAPSAGQVRGTSLLETSGATTTLTALSTSATQGFCTQFNATSTNTELNLTFAASSTASTVGVIPVVRYGACP